MTRIEAQGGGRPFIAMAKNISLTGMLIQTADPVPEGEVVRLKFLLAGSEREIRASGTVQHVSPQQFMGVRFNHLESSDAEAIKQFVESLDDELPQL